MESLANHLFSRGRLSEAEPLYLRIREVRETSLGAEHRLVAASLNNLAGLYYRRSEYAEAEKLNAQALRIKEETLGSDHLDVAFTLDTWQTPAPLKASTRRLRIYTAGR